MPRAVVAPPAKAAPAKSFFSSLFAKTPPPTPAPGVMTPQLDSGPIVSTPGPATAHPASSVATGAEAGGFALSATSQNQAWVRIGDHRTVMAKVGDAIPGLGKVTAIGTNSVTLDNGQILKAAP